MRKQRQVVEHRIARMMQLGMRQAMYCGRHKTLFQALMTAAVANLTLIAGRAGRRPGAESSTTAPTAATAAAHTVQAAFQTVWAWLRPDLCRTPQAGIDLDRPVNPSLPTLTASS